MKAFFWLIIFPCLPWLMGLGAAIGCAKAGVGVTGWWQLITVATVAGAVLFTWYGYKKGFEADNGIWWKSDE